MLLYLLDLYFVFLKMLKALCRDFFIYKLVILGSLMFEIVFLNRRSVQKVLQPVLFLRDLVLTQIIFQKEVHSFFLNVISV